MSVWKFNHLRLFKHISYTGKAVSKCPSACILFHPYSKEVLSSAQHLQPQLRSYAWKIIFWWSRNHWPFYYKSIISRHVLQIMAVYLNISFIFDRYINCRAVSMVKVTHARRNMALHFPIFAFRFAFWRTWNICIISKHIWIDNILDSLCSLSTFQR